MPPFWNEIEAIFWYFLIFNAVNTMGIFTVKSLSIRSGISSKKCVLHQRKSVNQVLPLCRSKEGEKSKLLNILFTLNLCIIFV